MMFGKDLATAHLLRSQRKLFRAWAGHCAGADKSPGLGLVRQPNSELCLDNQGRGSTFFLKI